MVKRIGIILMVLLGAISLLACGSSGDTVTTTSQSTKTSSAQGTTPVKTTATSKATVPGTSIAVNIPDGEGSASLKIGEGTDLPKGYPSGVLPIYGDSLILSVLEAGESYTVVAYSEDDCDDVIAFYESVFEDAEVMSVSRTETSYTSFGTLDGYTYTFDAGESDEYQGYKTVISVMIYK